MIFITAARPLEHSNTGCCIPDDHAVAVNKLRCLWWRCFMAGQESHANRGYWRLRKPSAASGDAAAVRW